jgi:hypothetical protein
MRCVRLLVRPRRSGRSPRTRKEERPTADDITLDGIQFPARIRVRETCLGNPALWIHDGCFDVAAQLTAATARALAAQLLARLNRRAGSTRAAPAMATGCK